MPISQGIFPLQRGTVLMAHLTMCYLRCSRTEPCSNCAGAKQECEYRETAKRRPVSRLYVTGLEDRVAWLEYLVHSLKVADPFERDTILAKIDLGDHLVPYGKSKTNEDNIIEPTSPSTKSYFHIESEGLVAYHGPTSIYRFSFATPPQVSLKPFNDQLVPGSQNLHTQRVAEDFGIDLQGDLINRALRQSFKWQYPHFMFIYREAFLRDHFSDRDGRQYWSGPLLLAMCALGLVMVPDPDEKAKSDTFFSAAETVLLVSGIGSPCIPTVQAFLCLALYEIGRGNLSSGWRFSGECLYCSTLYFESNPVSDLILTFLKESLSAWPKIWGFRLTRATAWLLATKTCLWKILKLDDASTGVATFRTKSLALLAEI
jgi:hypothetical protein